MTAEEYITRAETAMGTGSVEEAQVLATLAATRAIMTLINQVSQVGNKVSQAVIAAGH